MIRKGLAVAALLFAITATPAYALDTSTASLIDNAWPRDPTARLSEVGHGVGMVFSPDLSVPGNCRFYTALGFACFQDADWSRVLDDVRTWNIFHPENRIRTLVLETHGTNGNGLKLQRSYDPKADRSYVSVGALQEHLEPDGIRTIIISACNSGRLLRPTIVRSLDPHPGDKLFLPATCGIVDASADYDIGRSHITVATPASSHIETTLAGSVRELAPVTRRVLEISAKAHGVTLPKEFAVSDLLMQILLRDSRLQLATGAYVDELSKEIHPESMSEGLYNSFISWLNSVAAKEAPYLPPAPKVAQKSPRKAKKTAAKAAPPAR
jgi:hypothetical protein